MDDQKAHHARAYFLAATVIAITAVAPICVFAQQPFTPAPKSFRNIILDNAQSVLDPCGSWKPRVTTNQNDQARNKNLQEKTDILVDQLVQKVALKQDASITPNQYNGSFLRLLDSVDNFAVNQPDPELLGLAQLTDPAQLNMWGTSLSTIKFDCSSMLSLLVQANSSFSIPFVSLNAAFQANNGKTQRETTVFMSGLFQSPFEILFYGSNAQSAQQTYAALKAMAWRLGPGHTGPAQYISSGYFLSMNTNVTNSDTLSILGNFKSGVNIPFVQLAGSVGAQLSDSLQTTLQTYATYFWDPKLKALPDFATLSSAVAANIPQLKPSSTALRPDQKVTATTTVAGWPIELCKPALWIATFQNSRFKVPAGGGYLVMTPSPAASGNSPSCSILLTFQVNGDTTQDIADPGMALQHMKNSAASIPLHLSGALHWLNKPQLKVFSPVAAWSGVQPDPASKVNTYLQWSFEVIAEYPGRNIVSMAAERDSFKCIPQDGSPPLDLTDGNVNGVNTPTAGTTDKPLNPDQPVNALLSTRSGQSYNTDPSQPRPITCRITGVIDVGSQDIQESNTKSTDPLPFQTGVVFYPNSLPTAPPLAPTGLTAASGNTQVTLSWTATNGADSYEVYRFTAGGTPTKIVTSAKITKPSYQDSGLVNGTTYFYSVDAVNAAGPSPQSNPPVNASPLMPPLAPTMNGISPTSSQVTLSWAASIGAVSYNVYRSTIQGTYNGRPVGTVTGLTYTDSGLTNGTTYYYVVTAVNSAGEGPKGNDVTATPKP